MPNRSPLRRLLALPENRSALRALRDVVLQATDATSRHGRNLVFLHGPAGSGKTFLVTALASEIASTGLRIQQLAARDLPSEEPATVRDVDLLIVEDVQHLPLRHTESFAALLDERQRRAAPTIVTALTGPGRLEHRGTPFSARLTNRLGAGLVVALSPLQAPSRRRVLQALADDARLTVAPEILDWLAQQLTGGGRQLHGAIRQLKALAKLQGRPLRLAEAQAHFRDQLAAQTPTIERIADRVGAYFQVTPKRLQSARRSRDVLLPRQVSMYLARQLTGLSLVKIGKYFGGRDHKTVQHACDKVAAELKTDAVLSGVVTQMRAELT